MGLRPDMATETVTWSEVHRDSKFLVRHCIDVQSTLERPWRGIIGITRGGLVPTTIIAREMNIRLVDTLCIASYDEQTPEAGVRTLKAPGDALEAGGEGWLLVDDLVDTGKTAEAARLLLPKAYFVTLYAKPDGKAQVDTFIREFPQDVWVFFPWDTEPQYVRPLAHAGAEEG